MKLRQLLIIMCLAVAMIPISIIGGFQGFEFATLLLISIVLLVTLVVSFFISHFITRSVVKLTKNIDRISKGDLDVQLENSEIYEINNLTASLNRVMASLKLAIHKVGVKRGEIFEETMKARQHAEEKYQRLVETLPDCVWEASAEGTCTFCSSQSTSSLGYSPDALIGKSVFAYSTPDEAKKIKEFFSSCDQQRSIEVWWTQEDGEELLIQTTVIPLFDSEGKITGFFGFHRNLTMLSASLDDTWKPEQKTGRLDTPKETVVGKNPDRLVEPCFSEVMFVFDEHLSIIDCSQPFLDHLGYTKEEMLSLRVPDVDIFETTESVAQKLQKIKNQGTLKMKTMHRRKDGSSILVQENIQYNKNDDTFICYITEEHL